MPQKTLAENDALLNTQRILQERAGLSGEVDPNKTQEALEGSVQNYLRRQAANQVPAGAAQAPNAPAPASAPTRYTGDGSLAGAAGDASQSRYTVSGYTDDSGQYHPPVEYINGQAIVGTTDPQTIREQVRREQQARIDSLNAVYDQMVRQQEIKNRASEGSVRAAGARSGLLGSTFGTSQQQQQRQAGAQAVSAINAQRALDLHGVFNEIDELTRQKVEDAKTEALAGVKRSENRIQQAQANARQLAQDIARGGLSFAEFKAQEPERAQQLLDASNMSELQINAIVNANLPSAQQVKYTYDELKDGTLARFGDDGSYEVVRNAPPIEPGYKVQQLQDGTLVQVSENGRDIKIWGEQGQFAKETTKKPETRTVDDVLYQYNEDTKTWEAAAGGYGETDTPLPKDERERQERQNVARYVDTIKGSDDYLDTTKYEALREELAIENPGLLKWFDSTYPTDRYLNPNDPTRRDFNGDLGTSVKGPEEIGSLSAQFESGSDPGAIGYDRTGGYSYGSYQLAHGNAEKFVNQSPYRDEFTGKKFNTAAWRDTWKKVAKRDPRGFEEAQRGFIQQTHYKPAAQKIKDAGFSLARYSPVLMDVIWSTAVQHGPGTNILINAFRKFGKRAKEEDLIREVYNQRWAGGQQFASSTPAVRNAVRNRFFGKNGELNRALQRVKTYA